MFYKYYTVHRKFVIITRFAFVCFAGLGELVGSLQRVQQALRKNGLNLDESIAAVGSLMQRPEFQQVLNVHNRVQDVWCYNSPPTSTYPQARQLVQEVTFNYTDLITQLLCTKMSHRRRCKWEMAE